MVGIIIDRKLWGKAFFFVAKMSVKAKNTLERKCSYG